LTVSPGITGGANATSQKGVPLVGQLFFPLFVAIFGTFGFPHSLSMGAKRYVDIINSDGKFEEMPKGTFLGITLRCCGMC
jgi:hypothetical protein